MKATHWYLEPGLVCLPPRFWDDHADRDLPTPKAVKMRGTSYWAAINDPSLPELLADAEHYAHRDGPSEIGSALKKSAITTRNRIKVALKS